ncbi:hypothetical protein [Natronosalvus vescus]|uniref:hypothetical protein n=1 Tax=Natronosalvus vescus TaxID=2953881 RepID=UPI0020914B31|nr:hypothetical protein [Natronosalvus vescus]
MAYDRLAALEVRIDDVDHQRLERETSSDFTRVTTEIALTGPSSGSDTSAGTDDGTVTGLGEDVTYDGDEHDAIAETGLPTGKLEGAFTLESFSERLSEVDLFPAGSPDRDDFRDYRRWAFESAALDLALRQAGTTMADVVEHERSPVRFVASTRLGDPPTLERIDHLRRIVPDVELKLDPTSDWTDDVIDGLAATDAVRILDLKGQYEGTDVDAPGDPALYRRLADAFPNAVLEDPAVTPETRPVLEDEGVRERLSWDAPIHGVADIEALPWEPRWLNVKPSRFGSLETLLETLEYCTEAGIMCYGGGQFELGVGRGQIQLLASLFYPDSPNDVAPRAYNEPTVGEELPTSPLDPDNAEGSSGFRW